MNLDNLKIEKNNNVNIMGKIISEGLANPIVKSICTHGKDKNYDEIKKYKMNFVGLSDFVFYLGVHKILEVICY